jgi:2-dehydropantoate 2-reductase
MKICIVGAGAIGGYLAVQLAEAGAEVTVIARGAHLAAIRQHGLRLVLEGGEERVVQLAATDDMAQVGPQDVVIPAVKAQALPPLAAPMRALYGPDTMVVPAQNGIPWWYFYRHGGPYEGRGVEAVDPGGVIAQHTEVERVIGCVVYPAAEIAAPGVIRHIEGNRFILGELDGAKSERVQALAKAFVRGGLKAPVSNRIRSDVWLKLWGNATFNPLSALSRATLEQICLHPQARAVVYAAMVEAQEIANRLGITFGISIDQRIAGAEKVGAHKTSMLQDIEAGRATEADALVGAVCELGRLLDVPTPTLDALYASVKLLEQTQLAAAR